MRIAVLISFVALALSTSANGQTSSQIAARNPAETYSYFKDMLERLRLGPEAVAEGGPNVYLFDCVDVWWYIGSDGHERGNSTLEKTADLAFEVLYMQAALQV